MNIQSKKQTNFAPFILLHITLVLTDTLTREFLNKVMEGLCLQRDAPELGLISSLVLKKNTLSVAKPLINAF